MRKIFNYNKFENDNLNTLVESFGALCNSFMDGKANTPEYQEANKQFNEEFMKECVSAVPNTTFSGVEMMKNPMINGDICVKRS